MALKMKRIYLDYAAAMPVLSSARKAFLRALDVSGNPSAAHSEGREAKEILESARSTVARHTEVKPEAVTFTGNATEANALAIQGTVAECLAEGATIGDLHLLYMEGAHTSVANTMEALREKGARIDVIPLLQGAVDLKILKDLCTKQTTLVSIEAVSSETGLRADLRQIRRVLDEVSAGILLHVDASQMPLVESIERVRFHADFLTLDAQKIGGVRGIGALIRTPRARIRPLIEGGGQERGLRPGTESPALAMAFATALDECARTRATFVRSANIQRLKFSTRITSALPYVVVNEGKENAPHILNLSFPGRDTDYLVALMDESGVAMSTRSSCETDSEDGSRGVFALTKSTERSVSTVRISWGPRTTDRELRRSADLLIQNARFLDRNLA